MLESIPITIIVATLLGFLSGLGIGGGSLLILWLTLMLDMPQELASTINLMFFVPSAFIACFFRFRQGKLDIRKIFPAMLAGVISAIIFSWIGSMLDASILKKPFGVLLLITGLRELFYRPRNAK
jgi:uncharacterized membrane protein YfcA